MQRDELEEISSLITTYGIEAAVNMIDIEAVKNLSIKIILRTIQTSHDNLLIELSEALSYNT